MRRLLASIIAAVTLVATIASSAYADEQWCESDPVFIVDNVPIRATAGLTIDPARVVSVYYELHVPHGAAVSVAATSSARLPEAVGVYDDQPAGSAIAWLIVYVGTTVASDSEDVTVTIYGPTAQQPDTYAGTTNVPVFLAIQLN